jgi:hypothetical protein
VINLEMKVVEHSLVSCIESCIDGFIYKDGFMVITAVKLLVDDAKIKTFRLKIK